jgi:hypothetical protein
VDVAVGIGLLAKLIAIDVWPAEIGVSDGVTLGVEAGFSF